jgi:N-acetylglucosamine transport system permease protein
MTQPTTMAKPTFARRFERFRRRLTFDRVSFMAVFLVLPLAIFVIFELSPALQAVYYGMTDWGGYNRVMNFVGLDNFTRMFADSRFLKAFRNSALLCLVVPTVTLVLAFAIACVVTTGGPSLGRIQGLKGGGFHRVVAFFPYCVPAIVIGIIWSQAYDPTRGLLNGFLTSIGLDSFSAFAWTGNPKTALGAVMFVIVWGFVGFYMVLFVAAIKGIPAETYEAARIDGAGRFRIALSITLPQVIDSVQTAYIYLGLTAIDGFVYVIALNPEGGPNYGTLTISQDLYREAFKQGHFGYATAMGIMLALVTMAYAALVFFIFRLVRGKDDGVVMGA